MLNRGNLLTQLIQCITNKAMDVFWETEIFSVTCVPILCSLKLRKKEVSILFLRVERVALLELLVSVTKDLFSLLLLWC